MLFNKYYNIPITAFALLSFISIAMGNVLLGITAAMLLAYIYKNKHTLTLAKTFRPYYYAIGFFVLTMLLSALTSGAAARGMRVWADLWVWRVLPFFVLTLSIKDKLAAKKILLCALTGITLGSLCLIYQGLSGDGRASGFFGHPMTFAGYFCIYLPVLLVCFVDKGVLGGKWRRCAGVALALGCLALLFNATRGAWLACAAVLLFILVYYVLVKRSRVAVACLLFAAIAGAALTQYNPFMQRLNTITDSKFQSNTERLLIWGSAWNMYKDHPLLGVGLGQYKDNYQKKYISPKAKEPQLGHAHNNFFQMLAENGTVGFIGFAALIACFIGYSFYCFVRQGSPYALMMSMSALALVLQGCTEYNFGNSAVMKSFWLVQGCLLLLASKERD